jgi:hypothetical protein
VQIASTWSAVPLACYCWQAPLGHALQVSKSRRATQPHEDQARAGEGDVEADTEDMEGDGVVRWHLSCSAPVTALGPGFMFVFAPMQPAVSGLRVRVAAEQPCCSLSNPNPNPNPALPDALHCPMNPKPYPTAAQQSAPDSCPMLKARGYQTLATPYLNPTLFNSSCPMLALPESGSRGAYGAP